MFVKDLIEKLQKLPQNAEVFLDVEEENSPCSVVDIINSEEEEHYAKGDKPSQAYDVSFPYIMLY